MKKGTVKTLKSRKTAKKQMEKTQKATAKKQPKKVVKKKNTKKSVSRKSVVLEKSEEERERELIAKGKAKGFITQDEIMVFFPDVEENIEQLDEIYAILSEKNIEVVDSREKMIWGDTNKDMEEKNTSEVSDFADDSVRMYLREIGKIPLLTSFS